MNNQTALTKIKFGLGALALGAALVSISASAQDGQQAAVRHHHHVHYARRDAQTPTQPAQPAPCIHMQTSCP